MEFIQAVAVATGLGIWTALQPCPMATNIAAISFIGRRVESTRDVLLGGLLYALGRTLTYVALAILLVGGALSNSQVSMFLQKYMHLILGPILIIVAMILLELIRFNVTGFGISQGMQKRVEKAGIWGALLLGILFALSFCPISAACFFVSLFALLAASDSKVILPSVYGIGTALPVIAFAVLIAFSAQSVGKAFHALSSIEWWARRITGCIFLGVGIYFSLKYIFDVL